MEKLTEPQLVEMSRRFYKDAKVLHSGNRYAGAVYLAGYAVELLLKAVIVKKLGWKTYPPTESSPNASGGTQQIKLENGKDRTFLIHDIEQLALIAGVHEWLESKNKTAFESVKLWSEQMRYEQEDVAKKGMKENESREMLEHVRTIAKSLIAEFGLT